MIINGPEDAAFNMAADAYLLESAEKDNSVPVVRLYGWKVTSITIGYHQDPIRALDSDKLGETPVVRRITGGRALVHDSGEITYAVAGNFCRYPVLGDDLHASYNLIAKAIVAFYRKLGWSAEISARPDPVRMSRRELVQKGCMASVSRHEIVIGGVKMAAGSQRRTPKAFMQHGVIRLKQSPNHPAVNLSGSIAKPDFKPVIADSERLIEMLGETFATVYRVDLKMADFSAYERDAIVTASPGFKIHY